MDWLAIHTNEGRDGLLTYTQDELIKQIQSLVDQVEAKCTQASASPLDLPDRSRHAYQWLKFLADPSNLQMHVAALQAARAACARLLCRRKGPPSVKSLPVRIQFYLFNALYRVNFRREVILIQANERFITAPQHVIEALVEAALCTQGRRTLALVRQYADSPEYSQVLTLPGNSTAARLDEVKGKVYDLEASYTRVNQDYFNGSVERPQLRWNHRLTYRKLGHYQPNTDTIEISLTLDQATVPEFILDYVMYHELLHKHLGIKYKNGRQSAHTSRFRAEEKKYHRYTEAVEFINQIGQGMLARKRRKRTSGKRTRK